LFGGELAAPSLGLDHLSSYLGCSAHGCSSPWHHLVTHGLITRHRTPAQVLSSCVPGGMTLPVVGRGCPWPIRAPDSSWSSPACSVQRRLWVWVEVARFPASEDCSRQRTVLAPSTSRLETQREKPSSPLLAQTLPSALTVWDQSDVL